MINNPLYTVKTLVVETFKKKGELKHAILNTDIYISVQLNYNL